MTSKPSLWVTAGLITLAVALVQNSPLSPSEQAQNLADSVLGSWSGIRVFASQASPTHDRSPFRWAQPDAEEQSLTPPPISADPGQALSQIPNLQKSQIQQAESTVYRLLVPDYQGFDRHVSPSPAQRSRGYIELDPGLTHLLDVDQPQTLSE